MARGELDLYPRARRSVYWQYGHEGHVVCARCACEQWGIRSLWRAVHAIESGPAFPGFQIEARPVGPLLQESPGACCDECGGSFWAELPKGTS